MTWLMEHWELIGWTLGALDIVLGALPDRIVKWPGILLAVSHRLYAYGKEYPYKQGGVIRGMALVAALSLLAPALSHAADAELASGVPRQKSIRTFYVTGSSDISTSLAPVTQNTDIYELVSIGIHLSAAGGANDFTPTLDSALGAAYDLVILTQDMTSVTDLLVTYDAGEILLDTGTELDFAWTNGSSRTYGLEVKYRLK